MEISVLTILVSICVAGTSAVANHHSRLLLQSRSAELNAIVAGMEADRVQHDINTVEINRRGEQLKKMAEIIKQIQKDSEAKTPVDPPK
jgi:hypothetical protein